MVEKREVDPNEGSLPQVFRKERRTPRKAIRPDHLTELEKFGIQFDFRMGMKKVNIAKKWRLTYTGVNKVLAERLEMSTSMEAYLRKISFGLMETIADVNASIDQKTIDKATLAQRLVAMGIGLDKVINISKHLDGTKDIHRSEVVHFHDRKTLEDAVMRRLQEIPVVEEIDTMEIKEEAEELEEESRQLSLFPGSEGRSSEPGEEVAWKDVDERNGRLWKSGPERDIERDEEDEDGSDWTT